MRIDAEDLALFATPVEREAYRVGLLPKGARATFDRLNGTTPQSRSNALKRLGKRILAARAAHAA